MRDNGENRTTKQRQMEGYLFYIYMGVIMLLAVLSIVLVNVLGPLESADTQKVFTTIGAFSIVGVILLYGSLVSIFKANKEMLPDALLLMVCFSMLISIFSSCAAITSVANCRNIIASLNATA